MKILIHHPSRLPPKDYGGTERVVLWLSKGLVEHGHEVWVAAEQGSTLPPGVRLLEMDGKTGADSHLISKCPAGLDVIHFMAPPGETFIRSSSVPSVTTVHGNGKEGERFPVNSIFLTGNHAQRHSAKYYIFNGIDPSEYEYNPGERKDWFLFLSKTSWNVKNLPGAMRLCRKAGIPLHIAGGNRPIHLFLRAMIDPLFSWEGSVNGMTKSRLLSQARALLFPVLWHEPFGLVVAESLMSGTPVIAAAAGGLSEMIPENCGQLISWNESEDRWVDVLQDQLRRYEPESCRAHAMKYFHYHVMTKNYLECYKKVIQGETLNPTQPVGKDWKNDSPLYSSRN